METNALKYTVIKNKEQYAQYCNQLKLLVSAEISEPLQDEIDLLTLLIEKFDEQNNTFKEADPITLLRSFMQDHQIKAQQLSEILEVSKGYVSDILNYKKALSKDVIRKLADHFKVRQDTFNRTYKLTTDTYPGKSDFVNKAS
ncbi:helix-turn-helix domain-containing protein [Pedobacter duraquae]|uniref:HTH-type transcriptional regulator/antitoxin HigA n=1 Tax=Pedobacter duraquae TaxID=425511 RepID=A0A4R6IKE6_9SPHI|nr:helix-turn-helix domain-containing protein [Pedobacter duraquae]TDO22540.1 HTH-type transcriptional regulator/antitoxin HigA [Pedobacter duraquae]